MLVFNDNSLFACVWGDYSCCFHCKQATCCSGDQRSDTISHEWSSLLKVDFFSKEFVALPSSFVLFFNHAGGLKFLLV